MPFIKIAYDPDLTKIGDTVEVDDETARQMVSSGHGRVTRKPAGGVSEKKKRAPRKTSAKKAAETADEPTVQAGEDGAPTVVNYPTPAADPVAD